MLVVLRDGRKLLGVLRSYDQFGNRRVCRALPPLNIAHSSLVANLVLQNTIERIHVGDKYGDISRGIFLVRGESVVLLGEVVREKNRVLMLMLVCPTGPRKRRPVVPEQGHL